MIRPTLLASFLSITLAASAAADSARSIMKPPRKTGTVTVLVQIGLDATHQRIGAIKTSATIPAGISAAQKAQLIVANFYPNPHPWLTLTAVGDSVVATSKGPYEIQAMGIRTDETAEGQELEGNDGNPAAQQDGTFSLSGICGGFDDQGQASLVTMNVGFAFAAVAPFPGMPAELVEDELLLQLNQQGVPAYFATAADQLESHYGVDAAGDGRVLMLPDVGFEGFTYDVTDLDVLLDVALVIDREVSLGLGTNYCQAELNSTDLYAEIRARGSSFVADADLTLSAVSLPPNQFAYFLASTTESFVAFPGGSNGNLCLGGDIARFTSQVQHSGASGVVEIDVDILNVPVNPTRAILPGETWRFQCWFRDVEVAPTSNFTDGIWIEWQ